MKQKRYWLWGGIAISIIGILLTYNSMSGLNLFALPAFIGALFAEVVGCNSFYLGGAPLEQPTYCESIQHLLGITTTLIFYFLVGSVFGWLYGKYKQRQVMTMK